MHLTIIPKRYKTFTRILEHISSKPNRQAYQSELKRIVYPKSWHEVVKREFLIWNEALSEEFGDAALVLTIPCSNPATGRANEVLYKIPQNIELLFRDNYIAVKTNGGQEK